jgi:hypothetical protein
MKYIAKVHFKGPFTSTFIQAEVEQDEFGNPKKDAKYLYLKSGPIARKTIKSLEIEEVFDDEEEAPVSE